MGQLMIPRLGDTIELESDWTFRLHDEHRNNKMIDDARLIRPWRAGHRNFHQYTAQEQVTIGSDFEWVVPTLAERSANGLGSMFNSDNAYREVTLRAGTQLILDRYYIRKGCSRYDSVTFRSKLWVSEVGDPLWQMPKSVKSMRFWVKLDDANLINAKRVEPK